MSKIFTPPALPKVRPYIPTVEQEDDTQKWRRVAPTLPDPALTPDAAMSSWLEDSGRGLQWVDKKHAKQYAASCMAHGVPFTRDDGTQGEPREWRAWALGV